MNLDALLEEYVSEHPDKETYVRTVIGIFMSHDINEPNTKDYEDTLRYELQEKGIKGRSSYYNYRSAGKEFYKWVSTKRDKIMNETESKDVTKSEAESKDGDTGMHHIMSANAPFDSDTDMATGENTERQPHVQALSKRGRGRKPKPENANRTQISACISNEVYSGIKALAFVSQQPLSDLIAEILKAFYDDNHDAIIASVEIIEQSEIAKSKIKFKRN